MCIKKHSSGRLRAFGAQYPYLQAGSKKKKSRLHVCTWHYYWPALFCLSFHSSPTTTSSSPKMPVWSAVQCALLAITLCLGWFTLGVHCQLTNSSSLHSFFAPSLQPVAVNFLPAQSSVFFLSPNQTQQGAANPFANLLLVPGSVLNSNADAGNQIGGDHEVPVADSEPALDQSVKPQASIQNNTLFLSNPFAATPYKSNTETINSLIANIFGNLSLQSLPPEELIFGALPSPNATVTRTFVENIFSDHQLQGHQQTQPPSFPETVATESPVALPPPAENNIPPEVESDVNVLSNHVTTFGEVVGNANDEEEERAWTGEGHSTAEPESVSPSSSLPPPLPITTTESPPPQFVSEEQPPPVTLRPLRRFNLARPHFHTFRAQSRPVVPPPTAATVEEEPVTVAPVAPTLSADFEFNRIDSLPPWSTVNRIFRPPLPTAQPITIIRPSSSITPPPTTPPPLPVTNPIFVETPEPPPPSEPSPPPPPPTLSPQSFKFSKPIKLNSISRRQKFDRKHYKFTGRTRFTFELNNKKIVGGPSDYNEVFPSRLNRFFKPSKAAELGLKLPPATVSAVSTASLDSLLHSSDQSFQPVPQSPAQALGSIFPFALGPDSVEANTKWKSTLENIISLPNYKFYLGKKT